MRTSRVCGIDNASTAIVRGLSVLAVVAGLAGCGAPEAEFRGNLVYVHRKQLETDSKFTQQQTADIANVLAAYFGTPDKPHLPKLAGVDLGPLVDLDRVKMSAGRVASDKTGQPHRPVSRALRALPRHHW